MGYFLALLYMILIGMIFLGLDFVAKISGSFGWTIGFFVLGFRPWPSLILSTGGIDEIAL